MSDPSAAAREKIVDLVENRYFGNVSRGRVADVRACFTDTARVTIRHGDNPTREFRGRPAAGELPLEAFWEHLCANYDARFSRFEHVIDVDAARCASTFVVTLAPKPDSEYRARGTLSLLNCNFFWLERGRIDRMIVYYANPETGGPAGDKPTGYPPQPAR